MRYDLPLAAQGRACVDCQREFADGETSYRLVSGRPNSARATDVRARCQRCACLRGVVSALKDHAKAQETANVAN